MSDESVENSILSGCVCGETHKGGIGKDSNAPFALGIGLTPSSSLRPREAMAGKVCIELLKTLRMDI